MFRDSLRLYGDGAGTGVYEWDNGVLNNEWFTPTNSNIYTLTGTNNFTDVLILIRLH